MPKPHLGVAVGATCFVFLALLQGAYASGGQAGTPIQNDAFAASAYCDTLNSMPDAKLRKKMNDIKNAGKVRIATPAQIREAGGPGRGTSSYMCRQGTTGKGTFIVMREMDVLFTGGLQAQAIAWEEMIHMCQRFRYQRNRGGLRGTNPNGHKWFMAMDQMYLELDAKTKVIKKLKEAKAANPGAATNPAIALSYDLQIEILQGHIKTILGKGGYCVNQDAMDKLVDNLNGYLAGVFRTFKDCKKDAERCCGGGAD